MDGYGVVNYNPQQTSYGVSAATTELEDAWVQHGIVSWEQCFQGKGASVEQARQLAAYKQPKDAVEKSDNSHWSPQDDACDKSEDSNNNDNDDDFLDNDDDDYSFMKSYQQKRIQELQQWQTDRQEGKVHGEVIAISRADWMQQVNDASQHCWVLVFLTLSPSTTTTTTNTSGLSRLMLQAEQTWTRFARCHVHVKCTRIPAHEAIASSSTINDNNETWQCHTEWPESQLPTIFAYRHGRLQHDLRRWPRPLTMESLEHVLGELHIL
jgi:hypothetical protein